jgi:rod shape-determining protein MreC
VKSVRDAQPFKEILVEPSGLSHGLQDVLILVEGVHQPIPDVVPGIQPMYIAPPPPGPDGKPDAPMQTGGGTEADRLRSQYKALGEAQNHVYGANPMGAKPPDFTKLGVQPAASPAPTPPAVPPGTPPPGGQNRE